MQSALLVDMHVALRIYNVQQLGLTSLLWESK